MKHFVYSYRLTYCGGTAPCFDKNLLSLAICKRDMRRVMGRRFETDREKGKQNTYWFIGIVGTELSNKTVEGTSEKPFKGRNGHILYIAKLDDVVPYEEYFTSNELYVNRKDHIYEESSEGSYAGIWQELVIDPDQMPEPIKNQLFDWVETILK